MKIVENEIFHVYNRGNQKQPIFFNSGNEDYVTSCFIYILNNPVKAGLVQRPEDWEYSNYRDLLGLRSGDLSSPEVIRQELPLDLTTIREMLGMHTPVAENDAHF